MYLHDVGMMLIGGASLGALALVFFGIRGLCRLAKAHAVAVAARVAADQRAQDAENKLRLAECELSAAKRVQEPPKPEAPRCAVRPLGRVKPPQA